MATYNPYVKQGNMLQGSGSLSGATIQPPSAPLGLKATSPTSNIPAPAPKITPQQTAPKDLSSSYANVGGTIYNKTTGQGYSNPDQFFKDAGVNSFTNLKFDTAWKPTPLTTSQPKTPQPVANITPPANVQPTPKAPTGPYTPPNQGTTGVSQGGLIGNLVLQSQKPSQAYIDAKRSADNVLADMNKLQADYAQNTSDISGRPMGLSQQTGQQGILNQLFATKQAGLQSQYAGAASQLNAANTQQGLQVQAGTSAGNLNAPIVNPQTQGLVNPSNNAVTGSTTSGAGSLSSLIGQRQIPGQQQVEYYNTQTGRGFSSPQELADFVNQQLPNAGANASNVFSILKQGQGGDVVQPNDPYYQTLATAAQLLASNQIGPAEAIMGSMPPAVKAQVLRMAQAQGYNSNISSGLASALQQNTASAGTAASEAARSAYINSYPKVLALNRALNDVHDAGNLTIENAQGQNINPFSFVPANTAIQEARRYFSSGGQTVFDSNIANLKTLIANLNASGGTPTFVSENVNALMNGSLSMSSLAKLIDAAKQEGRLRLNNAQAEADTAFKQIQASSPTYQSGGGGNADPLGLGFKIGGSVPQNAQSLAQRTGYTEGSFGGQCGVFARNIARKLGYTYPTVGNTLASKTQTVQKYGSPFGTIGSIMITNENKDTGHVAYIIGQNEKGFVLAESNYGGNERVSYGRIIPYGSPSIIGFIRPTKA